MASFDDEPSQLKLISETFIRTKFEYSESKANQHSYHHLGPMDLASLSYEPMQFGLLFSTSNLEIDHTKQIIQHLLVKLKTALPYALDYFYPLAGQIATRELPNENACSVFVDCNKGPGARFLHASAEKFTVSDILSSTDVHPIMTTFFDLGEMTVSRDGFTRPLLSIQATELLDGVFIGFTMNHSIGDGSSLIHFISTLSEIYSQLDNKEANGESISITRKPILEPFFPEGYGPILKLPHDETHDSETWSDPGPLRTRIFHFSAAAMAMLKAKANEECGVTNVISSFQALSAILWRSIIRGRNIELDGQTRCSVFVNIRPRLEPPLSEEHFGNFIVTAKVDCNVGELIDRGIGSIAVLVHEAIKAQDSNSIREHLKCLANKSCGLRQSSCTVKYNKPSKSSNIIIGWSSRFDVYGPEFGLGRAMRVYVGSVDRRDGIVGAFPGREGGGSVDLEVNLRPETMVALETDDEFMSFVSSY